MDQSTQPSHIIYEKEAAIEINYSSLEEGMYLLAGALQCLKNWGGKNPKKTRFLMVWSQFLKKIGKILEKVRGQLPSCPPFSTALVSTNPWPLLGAKVKQKEQFFKKFWLFIIRLSKSICLSKYHSVRLFFWKILEDLILEGQRYLHTY